MRAERFTSGVRLCRPLSAQRLEPPDILQLDWSLWRPARDHSGRLVQLLDLPAWRRERVAGSVAEAGLAESRPVLAGDVVAADFVECSIGVGERVYLGLNKGGAARWEFSPSLGRLRGLLDLVRSSPPAPPAFHAYLLRLNRNLRFAGVGYAEGGIALQAVLIADDQRWVRLAQEALGTISEMLRLQVTWWQQPPELLAELFAGAGLCEHSQFNDCYEQDEVGASGGGPQFPQD